LLSAHLQALKARQSWRRPCPTHLPDDAGRPCPNSLRHQPPSTPRSTARRRSPSCPRARCTASACASILWSPQFPGVNPQSRRSSRWMRVSCSGSLPARDRTCSTSIPDSAWLTSARWERLPARAARCLTSAETGCWAAGGGPKAAGCSSTTPPVRPGRAWSSSGVAKRPSTPSRCRAKARASRRWRDRRVKASHMALRSPATRWSRWTAQPGR